MLLFLGVAAFPHAGSEMAIAECFLDFLIGLVLAQGVDRPDRRGHPANQGQLQHQAQQSREGTADGEEHGKRQEQGKQQAHSKINEKVNRS